MGGLRESARVETVPVRPRPGRKGGFPRPLRVSTLLNPQLPIGLVLASLVGWQGKCGGWRVGSTYAIVKKNE